MPLWTPKASTGGDMDDDLSFVSDGDLTTAGVNYDMSDNNNTTNNNGNNCNDNNDNNNDNDNNNNENNDNEHEHEHAEEEANPEEQVGKEQEEPENQNDLELNQAELNNDPGTTTGVDNAKIAGVDDAKIAGVEQIAGVEPDMGMQIVTMKRTLGQKWTTSMVHEATVMTCNPENHATIAICMAILNIQH